VVVAGGPCGRDLGIDECGAIGVAVVENASTALIGENDRRIS
jgi:hypothetical protein